MVHAPRNSFVGRQSARFARWETIMLEMMDRVRRQASGCADGYQREDRPLNEGVDAHLSSLRGRGIAHGQEFRSSFSNNNLFGRVSGGQLQPGLSRFTPNGCAPSAYTRYSHFFFLFLFHENAGPGARYLSDDLLQVEASVVHRNIPIFFLWYAGHRFGCYSIRWQKKRPRSTAGESSRTRHCCR